MYVRSWSRVWRLVVALLAVVLLAAACGNDDDGDDDAAPGDDAPSPTEPDDGNGDDAGEDEADFDPDGVIRVGAEILPTVAATQFDPNAPISAHRPVPDRTTSARSNPAAPGLRSRG